MEDGVGYLSKVIKLLVFDLDGTLVDTLGDIGNSVNHALKTYDIPPLPHQTIKTCIGDGAKVLLEKCLALQKITRTDVLERVFAEFMEHYEIHFKIESKPYPGVREALEKFNGFKKAILTNKPTAPALSLLDGLELTHHFDWILGGDNSWGPKPNPAALAHLRSLADAQALETLMIGDGIQDLQVARNDGTYFLGFLNGLGDRNTLISGQPDATLEDMRFLPELIHSFHNSTPLLSGNRKNPSGDPA